ncbi:MAG: hypothetical protein H0S85_02240 [Desulfovibrionaceae bacterium]|jgi:hypothetical protein|nr:hypothetical protein [Desulfovibrionaceae bacterium]
MFKNPLNLLLALLGALASVVTLLQVFAPHVLQFGDTPPPRRIESQRATTVAPTRRTLPAQRATPGTAESPARQTDELEAALKKAAQRAARDLATRDPATPGENKTTGEKSGKSTSRSSSVAPPPMDW